MAETWLEYTWKLALSAAVLLTALTTIVIWTLPSAYDPYNPDLIHEDDFSEEDKKKKTDSGYGYFSKHRNTNKSLRPETSVVVLVLGDIGSPRMQYHATSIAAHGGKVRARGLSGVGSAA